VLLFVVQAVVAQDGYDTLAAHEPAAAHEESDVALVESGVEGPTGRRPTTPANAQPKDKLDIALSAIKQDIMVRNRQLEEEKIG